MGIGDWGLEIGDCGLAQSPIPIIIYIFYIKINIMKLEDIKFI